MASARRQRRTAAELPEIELWPSTVSDSGDSSAYTTMPPPRSVVVIAEATSTAQGAALPPGDELRHFEVVAARPAPHPRPVSVAGGATRSGAGLGRRRHGLTDRALDVVELRGHAAVDALHIAHEPLGVGAKRVTQLA
jgi:hypothetical protein